MVERLAGLQDAQRLPLSDEPELAAEVGVAGLAVPVNRLFMLVVGMATPLTGIGPAEPTEEA